jgi:putative ABC transport system permease protein
MALPVLSYNFRNVRQRWRLTVFAVGGIAVVIAVFVVLIALVGSLRLVLAATGSPANAIVVQRGAAQELTSSVKREIADAIMDDQRVARDPQGRPVASPEYVIAATLPRRGDGTATNVQFRGVSPMAFQVRSGIRITAGRAFTPGLPEVIVGARVPRRFRDADIGSVLRIQRRDWTVVGVFAAGGGSFESEVWGDIDVMAPTFGGGGYRSVTLRMVDPGSLPAWAAEVKGSPRLLVDLKPERQFYEDQAGRAGVALMGLAVVVSLIMAVGGIFGTMNTMYAIVAHRTREIGTLRALGFSRRAIVASFVVESVLIAAVAGALGVMLAVPMNGLTAATGTVTSSDLAFALRITPPAVAAGLAFATFMGFLGGLLPAWRAARLPIGSALRGGHRG